MNPPMFNQLKPMNKPVSGVIHSDNSTRALFLDRDGVINHDYGYVHKIEDFKLIDGIIELTQLAMRNNFRIIVITNQAGIGRGLYPEADFFAVTNYMKSLFDSEGVNIDEVYFAPTHPEFGIGKYLRDDPNRKPNPGMLLQAKLAFDIDLKSSILIGDKESDLEAGLRAGVGTNILFSPDCDSYSLDCSNSHIHTFEEAYEQLRSVS